jgi:hypothetical protein
MVRFDCGGIGHNWSEVIGNSSRRSSRWLQYLQSRASTFDDRAWESRTVDSDDSLLKWASRSSDSFNRYDKMTKSMHGMEVPVS